MPAGKSGHLAGAHYGIDAHRCSGRERDAWSVNRRGDLADFANHDGTGLLGLLADGKVEAKGRARRLRVRRISRLAFARLQRGWRRTGPR